MMRATAVAAVLVTFLLSGMFPGSAPFTEAAEVKNTTIDAPANNSYVSGVVTIRVLVLTCNCSGTTALYVDGVFISNGTAADWKMVDGQYYEQFFHKWDSTGAKRGKHRISVTGKHSQYADTIYVYVGKRTYSPGATFIALMSVIIVTTAVAAYLVFKRRNIGKSAR